MAFAGNYEDLIKDLMRRTEEERKIAESRGKGEAGRRGLVGSDIEMSLRRAQTEPVVRGGQTDIANVLAGITKRQEARKYETGEREAGQEFRTGERIGGEEWRTGERVGGQEWTSGERGLERGWRTGERVGAERFAGQMEGFIDPNTGGWVGQKQTLGGAGAAGYGQVRYGRAGEAERGREHQFGMAQIQPKTKKKKWWEEAVAPIAGAAAEYGMSWLPTKKG